MTNETLETHQASPELLKFFNNLISLLKFFNNLISLKELVKDLYETTKNEDILDIHNRLDSIIKEKK